MKLRKGQIFFAKDGCGYSVKILKLLKKTCLVEFKAAKGYVIMKSIQDEVSFKYIKSMYILK